MTTLRLEPADEDKATRCACCGTRSRTVHGFIYRDDDAHAVYYAGWSDGHPECGVSIAIAVGQWGEGSSSADRTSIGIKAKPTPSSVDFTVLDPNESPWGDTPLFGKMLEREHALAHPKLKEVLQIIEHVVSNDARIRDFLYSIDAS
jgi:hypothetical protein